MCAIEHLGLRTCIHSLTHVEMLYVHVHCSRCFFSWTHTHADTQTHTYCAVLHMQLTAVKRCSNSLMLHCFDSRSLYVRIPQFTSWAFSWNVVIWKGHRVYCPNPYSTSKMADITMVLTFYGNAFSALSYSLTGYEKIMWLKYLV